MSVDRYLAICRPMTSLPAASQTRRWRMIVLAWIMAFVFATPQLVIFKQVSTVDRVSSLLRLSFKLWFFVSLLFATDYFNGPGRAVDPPCVYVCVLAQ